ISDTGRASRRCLEELLDRAHEAAPGVDFRAERALAGGGEVVVLGLAVVFGGPPGTADPALLLESVEGRVERALADLQRVTGPLLNALADPPAVHGSKRQRLQNQKVEGALKDVGRCTSHRALLSNDTGSVSALLSNVKGGGGLGGTQPASY